LTFWKYFNFFPEKKSTNCDLVFAREYTYTSQLCRVDVKPSTWLVDVSRCCHWSCKILIYSQLQQ
jgi:hypothetical protein